MHVHRHAKPHHVHAAYEPGVRSTHPPHPIPDTHQSTAYKHQWNSHDSPPVQASPSLHAMVVLTHTPAAVHVSAGLPPKLSVYVHAHMHAQGRDQPSANTKRCAGVRHARPCARRSTAASHRNRHGRRQAGHTPMVLGLLSLHTHVVLAMRSRRLGVPVPGCWMRPAAQHTDRRARRGHREEGTSHQQSARSPDPHDPPRRERTQGLLLGREAQCQHPTPNTPQPPAPNPKP
jgi:hypothetical protein